MKADWLTTSGPFNYQPPWSSHCNTKLTPFESLMRADTLPLNGMISIIYKLLMEHNLPLFSFQSAWQRNLQRQIEQHHWSAI